MHIGTFSCFPQNYPPILSGYTQEELEVELGQRELIRIRDVKQLIIDLDLNGYIEACSQLDLSIHDWIGFGDDPFTKAFGLPDLIKDALKYAARQVNREIQKRREEEMADFKLRSLNPTKALGQMKNNSMDRIFKE